MGENEFEQVVREVTEAVAKRDLETVHGIAARVIAGDHSYEPAMFALLGLAALDMSLPMLGRDGEIAMNPDARLINLAEGIIERLPEIECLYHGESIVRDACVISGSDRRLRAWAAFLLAVLHYHAEDAAETATWCERALGLDSEAAEQWGAWYYLWDAYLGLVAEAERARKSGQSASDDRARTVPALDWAVEMASQLDPKCRDFSETAQNLRKLESEWQVRFQNDRCAALQARGRIHEDGFTGKFLFEAALPYAVSDIQRIACHHDIAMDITILRYKREYILQIENATETEIADALSHARESWELAQRLGEAGQFPQEGLGVVKERYDMVRRLPRNQEQLRNMSHAERQELLDKEEQASLCRQAGDLDRALQLNDWCLGRANRNPLTWWNKGQIFMTPEKRDLDQAISCFRSAVALDPDDSDYWCDLGAALINTGQASKLDEAIHCCQEGVKRNRACEKLKRNLALATERKRGL